MKELEKQQQSKSKISRKKEITTTTTKKRGGGKEIDHMDTKKPYIRSMNQRTGSLGKSTK